MMHLGPGRLRRTRESATNGGKAPAAETPAACSASILSLPGNGRPKNSRYIFCSQSIQRTSFSFINSGGLNAQSRREAVEVRLQQGVLHRGR